jgi:glutaredoxin-like protein NrdH
MNKMAKVTVFTKNGCPQCDMTKTVLDGEGIEFKTINVEEVDEIEVEIDGKMVKKAPIDYIKEDLKFSAMPVVVAEGHKPFSGFRPDILTTLN